MDILKEVKEAENKAEKLLAEYEEKGQKICSDARDDIKSYSKKKEVDMDGFDDLVDRIYVVKKFRHKLIAGGHALLWWHRTHISKMCKYNYFIRQLNLPESMQGNLLEAIQEYVG